MRISKSIIFLFLISIIIFISCSKGKDNSNKVKSKSIDYTKYVDPYIGTDYHGHVFIGANVPNGGVQVGPNNYF